MRKIYIFLILMILIFPAYTQSLASDANVVGHVLCDGEHLPYINIIVEGTTIGTTTDLSGHYQLINLEPGGHTIVARGVGYTTQKKDVMIIKGKTSEVQFELREDVLNLEAVVVTADRNENSRAETPVVVNTIGNKVFSITQAVTIADGINFVPGLRMECNCQNCGFSQVRMNGMEGPYCQILINSRPVFSGLAGVYGMELLPTSMVERIEVVRGGGSALFGGNAIAGTINIITKEPVANGFSIDSRASVIGLGNSEGGEPAGEYMLNANGSIVSRDKDSGMFLYGMARDTDPYDENGDGFSERVMLNNTTFGLSAYHKPSQYSKISLDFYRINEFRRGGNKFDYLPHEADIAEQVDHVITGGNLSYDVFTGGNYNKLSFYASGQAVDRDSYYGAEQNPNAYGDTNDFTASIGGLYDININKISSLLLGIDNAYNTLSDTKLGANGNPNYTIVDQYINTIGSFAQYKWSTDRVKTTAGLRFDKYWIRNNKGFQTSDESQYVDGNVLAPRLNVLYDLAHSLQLRMSYSRGYRAPKIYDEDLHIEASGSRTILHTNAPDLTQETSNSLISSLRYTKLLGGIMTEILAEGFYTKLNDPFSYVYVYDDSNKTMLQIRQNAETGAYVAGVNMEFNAAFPGDLTMQAGLTLQTSEYEEAQPWGDDEESVTTHFMRSPGQYGFLTLDYHGLKNFDIALTSNFTGSMYVPHFGLDPITDDEWELINSGEIESIDPDRQSEIQAIMNGDVIEGQRLEKSENFLVFGIRIGYDIHLSKENEMQVYAGIQNIFNQMQENHDSGVYRDAGYVYGPCQPRTISIGMKIGNMLHKH